MSRTAVSGRRVQRSFGTSLRFLAGSNNVSIPNAAAISPSGIFSLSAWILPYGYGGGNAGRIFDKNLAYNFRLNSTTSGLTLGTSVTADSNSNIVRLGRWQHVAVTYDGTNARFYLNGVAVGAPAFSTNPAVNTNNLFIGNSTATNRGFDGMIDEAAVLAGIALTPAQVAQIASGVPIRTVATPTGLWLFDEGTGTSAVDTMGNNSNGTITGAAYSTNVPIKPRTAVSGRVLNGFITTDSFDRPNSATTMGVSDGGYTWDNGGSTSLWGISNNKAYCVSPGTCTIDAGPGTGNFEYLQADITVAGSGNMGLAFRATDLSNYLSARIDEANNIVLLKRVAAANTTLKTISVNIAASTKYTLRVRCINDRIAIYLDGVLMGVHTLSGGDYVLFPPTKTKVGFRATTGSSGDVNNFVFRTHL